MTFDEVETEVDQTIELVRDQIGVHEYPIKYVFLSSIFCPLNTVLTLLEINF